MTKIEKLREAFKADPSAENELALLRMEREESQNEINELKKQSGSVGALGAAGEMAKAIAASTAQAIQLAGLPKQRPTKTNLEKLILCKEVVIDRSEGSGEIIIVETKRENVPITAEVMNNVNRPAMTQARSTVFIPMKGDVKKIFKK